MNKPFFFDGCFGENVQPSILSQSQITLLPLVLEDGEIVERIAFGKVLEKDGVLMATDRRLIYMIAKGVGFSNTETFRFGDIESFEEKDIDYMYGYKDLTITNIFGYKYSIHSIDQMELRDLLGYAKLLNNEFKLLKRRKSISGFQRNYL